MASQADVRRIAMALPGTTVGTHGFAFAVQHRSKAKNFVWSWKERVHPKKTRVPSSTVIAVSVASLAEKQRLLASDADVFFTEPHYSGYPAVLVRLPAISLAQLRTVVISAWRALSPPPVVVAYDKK